MAFYNINNSSPFLDSVVAHAMSDFIRRGCVESSPKMYSGGARHFVEAKSPHLILVAVRGRARVVGPCRMSARVFDKVREDGAWECRKGGVDGCVVGPVLAATRALEAILQGCGVELVLIRIVDEVDGGSLEQKFDVVVP